MEDLKRAQTPSCGVVFVLGMGFSILGGFWSLAIERWEVIAFALVLAVMVAAAFGLVATGWLRRKGEGTWWTLTILFALTTSEMVRMLGVPWWGSLLTTVVIVLGVWLVVVRGLPWWQSRRGDSHR